MTSSHSYLSPTLLSREGTRRRIILLGLCSILVLSIAPVFGHHVAVDLEHVLHGRDHLWVLCLIAIHALLEPLHYAFHFLFGGGLLYAAYDRLRASLGARRVLSRLHADPLRPADGFWDAARRAGVCSSRIRVVDGLPTPAFTVGSIEPRILIAGELLGLLDSDQIAAVLAHEGAHLRRRDPLRLSLMRFVACTLFWIPALDRIFADMADEAEIAADDHAARSNPLALASALLLLSHWAYPVTYPSLGVGFAWRPSLLERRIRRLTGDEPPVRSHLTRRDVASSVLAIALVLMSGVIMTHPLPVDPFSSRLAHCDHPETSITTHLLCAQAIPRGEHCSHPSGAMNLY